MTAAGPRVDAPPRAPGAHPLFGHLKPLLLDPLGLLAALPHLGDVVELRFGRTPTYVVCSPEAAQQVLRNPDRAFDKGGTFYENVRSLVGDGMATCPLAEHKRLRRLAQPAFRTDRMSGYARTIHAQVEAATSTWRHGQVLDALPEMRSLATRTTFATMFRRRELGPEIDGLRRAVTDFVEHQTVLRMVAPIVNRLPTARNHRYRASEARLLRFLDGEIAAYRADGTDHGDLMSMFTTSPDGDPLTDAEVRDTVMTVLLGGITTTAVSHAWALHQLSLDAALDAEVAAEARAAAPLDTPDAVDRLPLTRGVVAEVLRHRTAGWIFPRVAVTDTTIGSRRVPAGAQVLLSPYVLHHRPDLFATPDNFDPHRWDGRDPHRTKGWLPFGAGESKCIGYELAFMDLTLSLADIVRSWRPLPCPTPVRPRPRLHLEPHGLTLRLAERDPR
ncbi:cytochrome P450 [Actinomadura sp. NEAU-AAG7]|uniref:cytochrome P450 n=1 Tax=Actinomadura sp. NEAU-AAG7 TaxID=2839640 RepID=UPI001BE4AB15|nr:cytochrome P450 [Actinomadura sp. NEAU-AAG7]MBT2212945.1 cytochrome P450 [Actinomadura sp. NEAU-AAG7]